MDFESVSRMLLMRLTSGMMGHSSSLLSKYSRRVNAWNKMILILTLIVGVTVPSSHTLSVVSGTGRVVKDSEAKTPAVPSPGRTNSRFLRNFPPYDFLDFARKNGIGDQSSSGKRAFVNGNSPVFYIRLPPAPYILVPGLGYVSPHPYNTNSPLPLGMSSSVMMMSPGGGGGSSDTSASKEQSLNNNVISLPLKFLSNGRPAQIDSRPVKKQPPKKNQISDSKMTTSLLSGGKYSFNGRPNGVFIVRSPVIPTAPGYKSISYMKN